jgi:hypothetical protein
VRGPFPTAHAIELDVNQFAVGRRLAQPGARLRPGWAQPVGVPAVELRRGVVTLGRYTAPRTMFVTPHGRVVYLQPLGGTGATTSTTWPWPPPNYWNRAGGPASW